MTTLVASSISLPEVIHSTMIGILKQSVTSDTNAAASGDGLNGVDKVFQAPSLRDAWQRFKSFAVFLADNPEYTPPRMIFFSRVALTKLPRWLSTESIKDSSKAPHWSCQHSFQKAVNLVAMCCFATQRQPRHETRPFGS